MKPCAQHCLCMLLPELSVEINIWLAPSRPSRAGGRGDRLPHNMRRLQSHAAGEEVRLPRNQRQVCEGWSSTDSARSQHWASAK